jgi:hypothetical protein
VKKPDEKQNSKPHDRGSYREQILRKATEVLKGGVIADTAPFGLRTATRVLDLVVRARRAKDLAIAVIALDRVAADLRVLLEFQRTSGYVPTFTGRRRRMGDQGATRPHHAVADDPRAATPDNSEVAVLKRAVAAWEDSARAALGIGPGGKVDPESLPKEIRSLRRQLTEAAASAAKQLARTEATLPPVQAHVVEVEIQRGEEEGVVGVAVTDSVPVQETCGVRGIPFEHATMNDPPCTNHVPCSIHTWRRQGDGFKP